MSWGWGNWSNWNNFDNFNNVVLSNPGYVDFTLQEPNSSNGGTISTTENTPVDLSTAVGVASGQSYRNITINNSMVSRDTIIPTTETRPMSTISNSPQSIPLRHTTISST
jgi:hypothetical protein